MNPVSAIQAALSAPIDPFDPGASVRVQVALAAAAKVLHVQAAMGAQIVALLDPAKGTLLNRSA